MDSEFRLPYIVWVEYDETRDSDVVYDFGNFDDAEQHFQRMRLYHDCRIVFAEVDENGRQKRIFAKYEGDS